MNKLQAMAQTSRLQHLAGGNKAGSIQSKLCVFSPARRPPPRTLAVEADPNSNVRLKSNLFGSANRLFELFQLFHDDNSRLPKFATEQSDSDKSPVLVAIADDQAFRVLVYG